MILPLTANYTLVRMWPGIWHSAWYCSQSVGVANLCIQLAHQCWWFQVDVWSSTLTSCSQVAAMAVWHSHCQHKALAPSQNCTHHHASHHHLRDYHCCLPLLPLQGMPVQLWSCLCTWWQRLRLGSGPSCAVPSPCWGFETPQVCRGSPAAPTTSCSQGPDTTKTWNHNRKERSPIQVQWDIEP